MANPELVAVQARRAADTTANAEAANAGDEPGQAAVVRLPEEPTASAATASARPTLPANERPLPTVTPYDQLLRRRPDTSGATGSTSMGEAVS